MTLAAAAGHCLVFLARLITGVQGHWHGCAPTGEQRIYFSNRHSRVDAALIWAALPRDLRASTQPIAAHDDWTAGCFTPRRAHERVDAAAVPHRSPDDDALQGPGFQALQGGDSIALFPDDPPPFKPDLYRLAEQFPHVPLIPVWIGSLPRGDAPRRKWPIPLLCSVTFGVPLQPLPGEGQHAFFERAREALVALGGAE